MIDPSVAHGRAHPLNPLDQVAARVEEEIALLREQRPGLGARLDRATNLLVVHLACPRQRVIRVRIRMNGHARFLVNGSEGAVYIVDPETWSCSCPDYHRRDAICKHALASYLLWRAAQPKARKRTCDGCQERFPRRALTEHRDEHLCRSCADAAGVAR